VCKETAILKQGEKKLLTNGGVGLAASQNKGICWTQTKLTVDPPAKLFASYNRGLAAAGYAVLGMHRRRCQRRGAVENTQHLRA
jgi:hypothetical protein